MMTLFSDINRITVKNTTLQIPVSFGCDVVLKREDLIHPQVSGNKFRKLKYNILKAISLHKKTLLTFGGAHSNHIAATAAAGAEVGLKTIGVIRGEELVDVTTHSKTLQYAASKGMELHFVSRAVYKEKETLQMQQLLQETFGDFYLVPEGGTNALAVKGCAEMLTEKDTSFDVICSAVGTGGTLVGLMEGSKAHQSVIGFSALKGTFQTEIIKKYTSKTNVTITDDYCMGGYAKTTPLLIAFMNSFFKQTGILLDPVYTGKMMFGLYDMIEKGAFKRNTRILAIHTGGLQGIDGMNSTLKKKNQMLIETI